MQLYYISDLIYVLSSLRTGCFQGETRQIEFMCDGSAARASELARMHQPQGLRNLILRSVWYM